MTPKQFSWAQNELRTLYGIQEQPTDKRYEDKE